MKGLFLSLIVFLLYLVCTVWFSRTREVQRHSKVFVGFFIIWSPVYFLAFHLAPPNLYFIPDSLLVTPPWLDMFWGYVVFALNFHSQVDFFYTINGGFSSGLMLELHQTPRGLSTDEIINMFQGNDEMDKIYAWRIPRLVETGYLAYDKTTGMCKLTPRGHFAARLTLFGKKILNLGKED